MLRSAAGTAGPPKRYLPMQDDPESPADELRDEAKRHESAAATASSPDAKKREQARAKESTREATEIENDLA